MTIPGGRATLVCAVQDISSDTAVEITWLVNGTAIEELDIGISLGGLTLSLFDITANLNNSQIQCVVQLASGTDLTSESVLLQLQGSTIANVEVIVFCNFYAGRYSDGC